MPKQRLHVTDIGAAAEQVRGAGVPERVRSEPDAEATSVVLDARAQGLRPQAVRRRARGRAAEIR